MTKKLPPVAADNRSPYSDARQGVEDAQHSGGEESKSEERGRHANIKQNTTHQGYQQDR